MTRAEHVRWCKKRALEYLPDHPEEAIASMLSDLGKHHETNRIAEGPIAMMGIFEASRGAQSVRRYIEGFAE